MQEDGLPIFIAIIVAAAIISVFIIAAAIIGIVLTP